MCEKSRNRLSLKECALGIGLLLGAHETTADEILNLGPLPGVGQITEILVPGNGQGFSGLATIYMGAPVIFYDGIWVQKLGGIGSPAFRFLRAHEYAHHFKGHVTAQFQTPPQMLFALGYMSELEADCEAVRYLKHANDNDAIQAGYMVYQQVVPPADMNGRPGSIKRTQNMNSCLGI